METGLWIAQERAIWKVLPLRPRPQPLESITSYITRLVEANGLTSIKEIGALAGGMSLSSLKRRPDYPAPAYPGLAQITGYPQETWFGMTFFHLVQHFGRSIHPLSLHRFLVGGLAPSLRYCPICLAEHHPAYYSLLWRFLALPGCIEHEVAFLDQCGRCGSSLPLWRPLAQLTKCPACQGDLRSGVSVPLESSVLKRAELLTNDLEMLLTSAPKLQEKEQAKLIGKRFQALRQQRDLLIPEVAHLLGRDASVIRDIDYLNRFRQASLDDYMRYADILGYRLGEVFDEQSLQELLTPLGEEQLLNQVQVAIHQLQARNKPILPRSVGSLIGMSGRRLKQYPRVKKLLSRYEAQRKEERRLLGSKLEDELVKQVEQTLKQLEAGGEPIVLQHVCDLVGLSYSRIVYKYPRIKALFHEYQKNRSGQRLSPRLTEEEKIQQVQAAINLLVSQGEVVTFKRVRQIVRLTQKQLRCSPRVKALLAQYIETWQREVS